MKLFRSACLSARIVPSSRHQERR